MGITPFEKTLKTKTDKQIQEILSWAAFQAKICLGLQ